MTGKWKIITKKGDYFYVEANTKKKARKEARKHLEENDRIEFVIPRNIEAIESGR